MAYVRLAEFAEANDEANGVLPSSLSKAIAGGMLHTHARHHNGVVKVHIIKETSTAIQCEVSVCVL